MQARCVVLGLCGLHPDPSASHVAGPGYIPRQLLSINHHADGVPGGLGAAGTQSAICTPHVTAPPGAYQDEAI